MTGAATDRSQPLVILVTCVGRRVELLQAFRRAAQRLGVGLHLIGADQSVTAPALLCADERLLTPPIGHPDYIPTLIAAARRRQARALIPTIDTDLNAISAERPGFEAVGCLPMIADTGVIRICRDKIETYRFLTRQGIDTPRTYTADEIRAVPDLQFPYFIKPRFGSASKWAHKVDDARDLDYLLTKAPDPIVQEYVGGLEHTLDVYVGLSGAPRCVVPRARWQVRAGEVSKGVVVKDREIMEAGRRVVEALGASPRGLVTLQCIVTPERRIRFIEINPRFGGGAPLGIAAGADYPGWLIQELLGETPQIAFDGFRHGTCLLRYDWSTFLALDDDLKPKLTTPLWDFPNFM